MTDDIKRIEISDELAEQAAGGGKDYPDAKYKIGDKVIMTRWASSYKIKIHDVYPIGGLYSKYAYCAVAYEVEDKGSWRPLVNQRRFSSIWEREIDGYAD